MIVSRLATVARVPPLMVGDSCRVTVRLSVSVTHARDDREFLSRWEWQGCLLRRERRSVRLVGSKSLWDRDTGSRHHGGRRDGFESTLWKAGSELCIASALEFVSHAPSSSVQSSWCCCRVRCGVRQLVRRRRRALLLICRVCLVAQSRRLAAARPLGRVSRRRRLGATGRPPTKRMRDSDHTSRDSKGEEEKR